MLPLPSLAAFLTPRGFKIALGVVALLFVAGVVHRYNTALRAVGAHAQAERDQRVLAAAYLAVAERAIQQRDSAARMLDSLAAVGPRTITRWREVAAKPIDVTAPDGTHFTVPLPAEVKQVGDGTAAQYGQCLTSCDEYRRASAAIHRADSARVADAQRTIDSLAARAPRVSTRTVAAVAGTGVVVGGLLCLVFCH